MATTWQGFTEEDQAKIKFSYGDTRLKMLEGNSGHIQSNEVFNLTNKKKVDKKTSKKSLSFHGDELLPAVNDLPAEALFTPKPKAKGTESPSHVKLKIGENSSFEILETKPLPTSDASHLKASSESCQSSPASSSENGSQTTLPVDLLQNGEKKDPINLEEFEKKQKLIEEQNRLKKELLGKALALRQKKAEDEAQKLHQIKVELSRLDASLSNDVGILRSHIEVASAELTDAEKRYDKAEREFIEAKQQLFSKRERKDLLTEHLCAIIEQNEMRKAHRLTNLMIQLNDQDQINEAAMTQIVGESISPTEQ